MELDVETRHKLHLWWARLCEMDEKVGSSHNQHSCMRYIHGSDMGNIGDVGGRSQKFNGEPQ